MLQNFVQTESSLLSKGKNTTMQNKLWISDTIIMIIELHLSSSSGLSCRYTFVRHILFFFFFCDCFSFSCSVVFSVEARRDVCWGLMQPGPAPWWTRFYYTGPVSPWASQSDGFGESRGEARWRLRAKEEAPLNAAKTSIPSSQSQPTELFKWCKISQEVCRMEEGEDRPNVTHWGQTLSITIHCMKS